MSSDDGTPVAPTREEIEAVSSASLVDFEYRQLKRRRDAADRLRREQLELEFSGTLTPAQEAQFQRIVSGRMTNAQLQEIPDPVPMIEGLLYRDSLAWIAGESGSYKSFVALDMAAHYANATTDYHGLRCTTGKVLIVVGEGNSAFKRRVSAWEEYNNQDLSDNVHFHNGAIQLGDRDSIAALHYLIRQEGYGLVVLDTQAMMTVGMEENDAGAMGVFVAALHGLRQAVGSCVLTVHHFGKSTGNMRGSGAMYAAATTVITTERSGHQLTLSTRQADHGKQKDGSEVQYPPLVMQEVAGSLVVTAPLPLGESAYQPELPDIDRRKWTRPLLERLLEHEHYGCTVTELWHWIEEVMPGVNVPKSMIFKEAGLVAEEGLTSGPKTKIKISEVGRTALGR
jgi:hypothetical protein